MRMGAHTGYGILTVRLADDVQAWAQPGTPQPLPMPRQNLLVTEAHQRLMHPGQPDLVSMPVGQIVGRRNEVRPVAGVISALLRETEEAMDRLNGLR
jgi:NAD(P)H-dependent flavin oxidoreductase YrpB (nitropropane dioxygenase family)